MRVTIERETFLPAVKRAAAVVSARNTIPALACLQLTASDTGLKIRGTNLDMWASVKAEAATTEPGVVLVDAALLSAWLAAAPKESLVEISADAKRATMKAGRATASFALLPADEFPTPPERDAKTEVPGAVGAIRQCAPYTSNEEARYYLNGVAIVGGHAVATNGHILCGVDISAPSEAVAIIPLPGVKQIAAASDTARVFVGMSTWACEDGNVTLGGKLIDGTFPDWQRAVPKDVPVMATLDADAMSEAVGQVQIASGERARVIVIEGADGSMAVSCQGAAMEASATVAYEGEPMRTGMNSKYALTAMQTFQGRVVTWAQASGLDPIVLTSASAPGLLACVFPMRV